MYLGKEMEQWCSVFELEALNEEGCFCFQEVVFVGCEDGLKFCLGVQHEGLGIVLSKLAILTLVEKVTVECSSDVG